MNYPDADKHFWASMTKSVIRVAGYCLLPFNLQLAMAVLVISEVVGIIEELV
tara:strand:+ start:586 stop:741 length:156 start_codon:yes stop_codon:yes gene_type:complete